jgi:hypothetical protein
LPQAFVLLHSGIDKGIEVMRVEMKNRNIVGIAGTAIILLFATTLTLAHLQAVPTSGPAENGNIA